MSKKLKKDDGPKVARAYIRVSHQGLRGKTGGGEFLSPDSQLNEAKAYANLYLKDFTFDETASVTHSDIDRSASRLKWQKRDGLVAHLEAAKRGELQALVVFKLSRFARNAKEGLELFELFENAGCNIHCIKDQIDTSNNAGRLIRTVLLAVAEMESANISDFVKAAARTRAERGLPHGSPPFWISRTDNGYELNDRAADIRRLIELRLQGVAQAKIAGKLNAEGFRTAEGRSWTSNAVSLYLKQDKLNLMLGHYTFGVDLEDGDPNRVFVKDVYPPVIAEEQAERVIAFNRKMIELYGSDGPKRAAVTTYILSGMLRCATCGSPMHSRTSYPKGKPSRASYECRAGSENNVPHIDGVSISADMIEDAVLRVVQLAEIDYRKYLQNAPPPKLLEPEKGSVLDKKLQKLTEKISRLVDSFADGALKREDFQPKYDALVSERDSLKQSLQETDSAATIRFVVNEALEETDDQRLTVEHARRLILAMVEKIEAPVAVDPKQAGLPKAKRCRGVWVTLRLPLSDGTQRILAPMYDARFQGERLILDRQHVN